MKGSGRAAGTGTSWRPRSRHRSAGLSAASRESTNSGGSWTRHAAWIHHHSAGSMASASAPHGRLTCGDAFARKKPPRRPKATRSQADYEFARQSLAAAVARAYFSTIEAAQQAANAQETLESLPGVFEAHRRAQGAGLTRATSTSSQIKARTAGAQDALYTAQAARAQAIRAIEVVTSHYPAGRFDVRRSFPGQPRAVPAGLPAQILERRPDVIAGRAPFRRRLSSRERSSHRAPAALCDQRHGRTGNRATRWRRHARCRRPGVSPPGSRSRSFSAVNSRLRRTSAPPSKKPPPRATSAPRCAPSKTWKTRWPAITICANAKARWRRGSSSGESVKFGREQLEQGQIDTFTTLRLAGENLAAKVQLTQVRASRLRERVNLYLALGGDFKGTGAPEK